MQTNMFNQCCNLCRAITITLMLGLCSFTIHGNAGEIRVAVAANFTVPARQIAAQFQTDTGHVVTLSFGSTGKFYAQIKAGAPFDVLLAADMKTPQKLAQESLADPAGTFVYATGKLVLWSSDPKLVDEKGDVLRQPFGILAIANPKLAPYGLAAQESLTKLGLWKSVQKNLVMGENISQTMQFVDSDNANLAFIALSQTIKNDATIPGSLWLVPAELYNPIQQGAIRLLSQGQDQTAVLEFLEYLKKPQAVTIIKSYGYDLP